MDNRIKQKIYDFSVNNEYIPADFIIDISLYICKKYGYDDSNILQESTYFDRVEFRPITDYKKDKGAAWNRVLRAATEQNDEYALATVLFYKTYNYKISEIDFYVQNEDVLLEMIEHLESITNKSAFVYFLLARANLVGRGVEINIDKALEYFKKSAANGIDLAKLIAYEIDGEFDMIAKEAKELIKKYPNNHIVKYYYGLSYYNGSYKDISSDERFKKVCKIFSYTEDLGQYNDNPHDVYFFESRYMLGLCYFFGKGVEKDLNKAHELFRFSAATFMPHAKYAQAITNLLMKKETPEKINSKYVFNLLKESALKGYLPAVRKIMLCLRVGYGTEINNDLYDQYKEFFDHYKNEVSIFSDLGEEADNVPLIKYDGTLIMDEEF